MKYAVIKSPGVVTIEERSIPTIDEDEMLVKVTACGVCGATDYHYLMGELDQQFPLDSLNSYFGHEGVGIVEKVGAQVEEFREGDRIGFLGPGYLEYSVVSPHRAIRLPEGVPFTEGLAEPLAVILNTLDHAALSPGGEVVILGAGFMGLLLVQGFKARRAKRIIVTDIDKKKLQLARELGSTDTINSREKDPVQEIMRQTDNQGISTIVEAAGVPETLQQAGEIAAREGKIVIHGYYYNPIAVDLIPWHCKELTIINSHPSTEGKMKKLMEGAVIELAEEKLNLGKLITHRFRLEEIPEMFEMMKRKEYFIKIVVEMN